MHERKPGTKLLPTWLVTPKSTPAMDDLRGSPDVKGVCIGDWVKIKHGRPSKGLFKFWGPFRVKQAYSNYVLLDNDNKWNERKVAFERA